MLFDIAALKTTLNNGASFPLQIPSSALLNFLPVVPAMLSAIVAREVPSKRIGFPIMGFAASGFYILSLATLFWAWDHWG